MQNLNNALRLGTFISQLEAGRREQVAAMVVEATLPYGHLDDDWPGRDGREIGMLSRALARAANPTRGLSEAQLLELLQDTFAPVHGHRRRASSCTAAMAAWSW